MRFSVSSLLTLAAAATAVVAQPSKRAIPLNPPKGYIQPVDWKSLPAVSTEPITNAKRFAQGLPPLNPRRRNPNRGVHGGAVHARQGTRVASAPRAETSSLPPVTAKCNIFVQGSGLAPGYISAQWNDYAEYGPLLDSQDGALEVQFTYSPDSPKQLDLVPTNGKSAAYPYFGGSVGFASTDEDLSNDNFNYLILTGTTQTPAGSTPSYEASNAFSEVTSIPVASASAIWSYDPASQALTAGWVNNDGSSFNPHILMADQNGQTFFTLTGNPDDLRSVFGVAAPEVTFTCVPPVTST